MRKHSRKTEQLESRQPQEEEIRSGEAIPADGEEPANPVGEEAAEAPETKEPIKTEQQDGIETEEEPGEEESGGEESDKDGSDTESPDLEESGGDNSDEGGPDAEPTDPKDSGEDGTDREASAAEAEPEPAETIIPAVRAKKKKGKSRRGHKRPATPGKPKKRIHRKKNWLLRLLIAAALIAAFFVVATLPAFEITHIAVIGNKTVSDKKIRKLSQIRKGDSIFFINPLLTSSRIKQNHYIEHVNIDRHLPGTVEIIVKEREAAAQFVMRNKKGKKRYVCIDQDGMVLGRSKKQKHVTMVINVRVLRAEKGKIIKVDDNAVYHDAMDLIKTAKEGDLYFKRIFIKGTLVHAYIYDDLKCAGRYNNVIKSIRSGTLKSVVYRLYQDDVSEGTINIGDNNYCAFTP